MGEQTIDFKDQLRITAWLDTALKKEKEKYKKCPLLSSSWSRSRAGMGLCSRRLLSTRRVT